MSVYNDWVPTSKRLPDNAFIRGGYYCTPVLVSTKWGVTIGWFNPDADGWYVLVWFKYGNRTEKEEDIDFTGDIPKVIFLNACNLKTWDAVTAWTDLPKQYTGDNSLEGE